MQTSNILSAPLIDIIFDGRNKDYGAYELRKKYNKRISRALLITGLLISLSLGTALLARSLNKKADFYNMNEGVILIEIEEIKKSEKLPEPDRHKPKEPEVQTERLTNFVIVEQPETPPPSQTDLADSRIDVDPKDGKVDDGEVDPGPRDLDKGNGIIEPKITKDEGPAVTVDIDAKYEGWKKFLEKNLNGEVPVNNNAPAGRYSVVIRFVVDTDGSISEITPLTAHGYGLEEEGVRVIKKAKKWEPAFLNGIHVKAYKKQVIVFEVLEE